MSRSRHTEAQRDDRGACLAWARGQTFSRRTSRWRLLMSSLSSRSFMGLLLCALCLSMGCASRGPTRLCDSFQSYQTLEDVRAELGRRGIASEWKETSKGTSPDDPRPPYKFTYVSGPFTLSGTSGQLKLSFYNGRLMEAQFSPQKGNDYMATLREQHLKAPQKPGEEIVTDRRTRLRFDVGADGSTFFTWYDPKLENEWKKWLASNT
jgi:hypothetical protein